MKLKCVKGWNLHGSFIRLFLETGSWKSGFNDHCFLTLCVIFVNGWTDAPNAIATCVSTRSMDVELAIIMAAVCNFAGVMVMTMVNSTVAMTITNMVNFGGDNHRLL